MYTVSEVELEQRTSEYVAFIKDFALKTKKDFMLYGKHDDFKFSIFDNDVTLEFSI